MVVLTATGDISAGYLDRRRPGRRQCWHPAARSAPWRMIIGRGVTGLDVR
jgi:hypothetical protein